MSGGYVSRGARRPPAEPAAGRAGRFLGGVSRGARRLLAQSAAATAGWVLGGVSRGARQLLAEPAAAKDGWLLSGVSFGAGRLLAGRAAATAGRVLRGVFRGAQADASASTLSTVAGWSAAAPPAGVGSSSGATAPGLPCAPPRSRRASRTSKGGGAPVAAPRGRPPGPLTRALTAACLALAVVGAPAVARADEARPLADEPAVEARLMRISEDIRCLVCQNESLAGSRADLANDLRREIRAQIKAGRSDAEITEFLVSRYGDFVLYRPPVKPLTWALWFGPFALLLGGVFFLLRFLRQRQRAHAAQPDRTLTDDERRRAQAVLDAPEP